MSSLARPSSLSALDPRRSPLRFDGYLLASMLVLLGFGLTALYSKSFFMDGLATYRRQVLNVAIGFVPLLLFYFVHPHVWQRYARAIYGLNVGLLILVLQMGKKAKGAERWLDLGPIQFQPSELAKLLVVLTLASFLASRMDSIHRFSTFVLGFLHVLVPMALILRQPHLGATVVVFVAWFVVSFVGRIPWRFLLVTIASMVLVAGLVFAVPAVSDRFLHDYQKDRISGLRTTTDAKGKNWQTDRAEIAFGVGGVFGTGFKQGKQTQGGFIPEQQTDFIFSVVGEEAGLVGCTLLLLAYGFFFYRVWLVMLHAEDMFYKMVAGGLFGILFFHAFVNMAMVLHLVPVVGLWLPFLSYGGTAVWLCMASVGLLLNIRRRENTGLF